MRTVAGNFAKNFREGKFPHGLMPLRDRVPREKRKINDFSKAGGEEEKDHEMNIQRTSLFDRLHSQTAGFFFSHFQSAENLKLLFPFYLIKLHSFPAVILRLR